VANRARVCYLIPVYRNQTGLDESLKAIVSEREVADVFVVDDGSPEPLVIRPQFRRADRRRVTMFRLVENRGITVALNAGLERVLAEGYEYVARLDAGDTVADDRIAAQSSFLDAHGDVGLVTSDVAFKESSGKILYVHRTPTGHESIVKALRFNNCLLHPAVTMRLDVLKQVGFYQAEMKLAEDYDLFLRIARSARVASLPSVLTTTRFDPEGLSLGRRRAQQCMRLVVQGRYFEYRKVTAYLGIARTIASMAMPTSFVIRSKRRGYWR
jgi:glycosyltransferase involved in cell wall biosynthesis